jgi:beta-1,4-mannosyltransferase
VRRDSSNDRILLFVVPKDANPYQELLYGPMREAHSDRFETLYWTRRPWLGIPHFFLLALWAAAKGSHLVHVHWLAWDLRIRMPLRKQISGLLARAAIKWLIFLDFRIIWTVHNVIPHEEQTKDDLRVGRLLARSATTVIAHSSAVLDLLLSREFSPKSAVIIPHGSYVGLYGSMPSRDECRRMLALPQTGRVLLFFGLIRAYKGIPPLLNAWKSCSPEGTLVIAGACTDPDLNSQITVAAMADPSIETRLKFVPDQDVATYFGAADGICLPFQRITTSGSVLLALSFGKPLIAPRMGSLLDLPGNVGFFYGDGTNMQLKDAVEEFLLAPEPELSRRSANALLYAQSLSWAAIAEKTYSLYRQVDLTQPP